MKKNNTCNKLEQSILFNNKGEGGILTNSISVICSQFTHHTQHMDKNNRQFNNSTENQCTFRFFTIYSSKKKVHLSLFYFVTYSCTSISKKKSKASIESLFRNCHNVRAACSIVPPLINTVYSKSVRRIKIRCVR